jgi:hypothetical protein
MLEKIEIIDKIEVIENGTVQVRQVTKIMEDGKQLSHSYHRWCILPGQDYSSQHDRVKAVCNAVHTQDVVNAYKLKFETQEI